eukprot:7601104-Alexandrium_andersonii.AAC.1
MESTLADIRRAMSQPTRPMDAGGRARRRGRQSNSSPTRVSIRAHACVKQNLILHFKVRNLRTVSYTHLTLPTICSV